MQNKTNERGEDSNRDSDRNEQMERQVEDGGKKSEKTDGGRDHRRRANGDEEDGHERPIEESSNPQNVARLPGRQDDDQAEAESCHLNDPNTSGDSSCLSNEPWNAMILLFSAAPTTTLGSFTKG